MVSLKYTPNCYRHAKTRLRESQAEYKKVRLEYFRDRPTLSDTEHKDRFGKLLEARAEVIQCRSRVHTIEDTGVELGGPISPRLIIQRGQTR